MLVDTKQRINGSLIFLLEFYKILMGTFLTIFVPHSCGNNTCTIMENMNSGNPYRSSVLVINTISFGVFLMMYYSAINRENWCISYLDINPQKPIEYLDVEIENYPKIKKNLVKDALDLFFDIRKIPGMKKKPSTSELIDWLKLLMSDELPDEILKNADSSKAIPPLYGALLKNEQDVQLLERLAFMSRRDQSK